MIDDERPGAEAGPLSAGTDACQGNAAIRQQLSRLRTAAARCVPLDCGCRDPWRCTCTEPPLSEVVVDGWRDSAVHILSAGLLPRLPIEVLRALYRRGGRDRVLAEMLHDAIGGEAT